MLVGLDWAKPMIFFFSLHITWPCIVHAYIPFLSLIRYSLLMVFFYLSLSLSLSLSHSLCMAPKHKITPSRNPLRSEASSSSDPIPLHVKFYDEKACQDFSQNFSRRGVHLECHVILLNFSDTDLPAVIHRQGWESLCEIPVSCPTVII